MRMLPPSARLATAALWVAAALLSRSLPEAAAAYGGALLCVAAAGRTRDHARFAALAGGPLLAALLLTWGVVMPMAQPTTSPGHLAGSLQALLLWLRILAMAATCQWLLLPLVREPLRLRRFVSDLHMPPAVGVLLATPVLILPEVYRQIRQVTDARRAQQLPTRGLRGLLALPSTIVPVLAALIETSLERAELWEHRGLLAPNRGQTVGDWLPWWYGPLAAAPAAALLAWELAA